MKKIYSLLLAAVLISAVSTARAGGPIAANGTTPQKYGPASFPLPFRTDLGLLGSFTNAQAVGIAVYAFAQWDNISTAALSFTNAGSLARDVTSATDPYISGSGQYGDGINPVVFDVNGSITDARLGSGARNSVLGFAGSAYNTATNLYVEGSAIINGYLSGSATVSDEDRYRATMTHEIGHFLGLNHSQIGLHGDYPTMYPVVQRPVDQQTLDADDIAAMSELYPTSTYTGTTGRITGTVTRNGGVSLSGVNVVAMNTSTSATYSTVVDYFSGGGGAFANPPSASGTYTLSGLPAGNYYVRIEPINANFTSGSSVASYATPINTTVEREWYNGGSESGDMLSDNTNDKTAVSVSSGGTASGINFVASESLTTSSLSYHNGTVYSIVTLPSTSVTRYANKFTAPSTGSLVALKLRLDPATVLPLNGVLTVAVHINTTGGLAGIPGATLGSVDIPYTDLVTDQDNIIYLRGIGTALNFTANTDFHVSLTTNGVGSIRLQVDNGSPTQNRSSFYTSSGGWRNTAQGFAAGYNLIMSAIYSTTQIGGAPPPPAQPQIAITPNALTYGNVRVGTGLTKSLTVSNPGSATLNVTGSSIAGADSTSYKIMASSGAFSLAPGASRTISVRFGPLSAGSKNGESPTKSARLMITSNAPTSPDNVPLTGTAVKATATTSVSGFSFQQERVGEVYLIDTALITNPANDTLHISQVEFTGSDRSMFRVVKGGSPAIVAPDSTYRICVEFCPRARRQYSTTLHIVHDDDPTLETNFTITGTGIAPVISAPAALAVGNARVGAMTTSTLMIHNMGDDSLKVKSLSLRGANAGEFTIVSPQISGGAPMVIAPGDLLPVEIQFRPGQPGQRTATLAIASDDPTQPTAEVSLDGRGLLGTLTAAEGTVDFGDVMANSGSGDRSISVRNTGSDTATITLAQVSGNGFTLLNPFVRNAAIGAG